MSIHLVRELYEYAELPFDATPEKIEELKKVLLLHLKSKEDGKIIFGDKKYTKNDILKIFDTDRIASSFLPLTFINEHPEIKGILNSKNISLRFEGNQTALIQHDDWPKVQAYLDDNYYMSCLKAIRADLKQKQFSEAEAKISYSFCFSEDVQFGLFETIKTDLIQIIINSVRKKSGFNFIAWDPYYEIVKIVGNDDLDFLQKQYNEFIASIELLTYKEAKRFCTKQIELNYDDVSRQHIIDQLKALSPANHVSNEKEPLNIGSVLIGAVAIGLVIILISKCGGGRPKIKNNRELMEQLDLLKLKRKDSLETTIDSITNAKSAPIPEAPASTTNRNSGTHSELLNHLYDSLNNRSTGDSID